MFKSGSTTSTYEIFCTHMQQIAHLGITMCSVGDPSHCDTCEFRHPETYEATTSWASIDNSDDEGDVEV